MGEKERLASSPEKPRNVGAWERRRGENGAGKVENLVVGTSIKARWAVETRRETVKGK